MTQSMLPRIETEAAREKNRGLRIAYIMSRFPKITETFILFEMREMERQGMRVDVYPLQRERATVVHPEAVPYVERAHFTPWLSPAMLVAHLWFLLYDTSVYLSTLWTLLSANWGSLRYWTGAVAFFPKAVYLARRMQAEGVQHVHAHFASHPAAVAFVIGRLTGIPFSFTAHGSDLHRDRHMLREKANAASVVITISEYNRRMILDECRFAYAHKVKIVHCGIDTTRYSPRHWPTPFESSGGPFQIICVGTLHEVKGQRFLLDACGKLKGRQINFVCHVIGDGPDRQALEKRAARLGLTEKVRFHGTRTAGEVTETLRTADVLVAPSVPTKCGRREGIPVVLMEALASGVPVISSNLSGIPELVTHEQTGLLAQPGDTLAIADGLQRLHGDARLRHSLGAAGRRKVETEFDLEKSVATLAAILEQSHDRVGQPSRMTSTGRDLQLVAGAAEQE